MSLMGMHDDQVYCESIAFCVNFLHLLWWLVTANFSDTFLSVILKLNH